MQPLHQQIRQVCSMMRQIITNNTSRYVIDATMHLQQPSKNDESYRYVV